MQTKRFRSETVRDALAQARVELGPDALVLATRLVPAAGPRGWFGARVVEVTAAADRPAPRKVSADRLIGRILHHRDAKLAPAGVPDDRPAPPTDPALDSLVARLVATGLDRAFAASVALDVPRGRRRDLSVAGLRRAVAHQLEHLAGGDDEPTPTQVFVGPPGVGKTTTIAKLAAQERVHRGVRYTLVAADGYRVGAVEQLRLYADILGARFLVARSPEELAHLLGRLEGPALVDTAGRSPQDDAARGLFEVFAGFPGVRTHLVIPASAGPREAERLFDLYADAQPARVVLGRVDETESLAPLVAPLAARRARVSWLGTGQRVPEDLERATSSILAARVLGEPVTAGGLA